MTSAYAFGCNSLLRFAPGRGGQSLIVPRPGSSTRPGNENAPIGVDVEAEAAGASYGFALGDSQRPRPRGPVATSQPPRFAQAEPVPDPRPPRRA